MKIKIKVKVFDKDCMPTISPKGDWIDLRSAIDVTLMAPQAGVQYQENNVKYRDVRTPVYYIPLGVAMELPKGYEAIVASRSGTPNKFKVFIPSGQGIIDSIYNGDNDQWYYVAAPLESTKIDKGDRICQFRIQLSQKATMWQKIKWLFSSGVELVKVDKLKRCNRGMNVTGVK